MWLEQSLIEPNITKHYPLKFGQLNEMLHKFKASRKEDMSTKIESVVLIMCNILDFP